MKQFKKILALLLVVSLGTVVACGDDNDSNNNNSDNKADAGLVDTDNTEADTDDTEADTDNTEADTGDDQPGTSKQLQDLSAAELSALCKATNEQESELFDPATDFGKANCLIDGALSGDFFGEDEAEIQEICEETQTDCLAEEIVITDECVEDTAGCTATVAEFEKCSLDYIAAEKAFLNKFAGQTCSNYITEDDMEALDELFASFEYPASCEIVDNKCPDLYGSDE